MKKTALAALAVSLMSGCLATSPAKRYFQIRSLASLEPACPKIERRLLVEPAAVDSPYRDVRIVYRVSSFEFRYYPYEFWAERPGDMIGAAMADFLVRKKAFAAVGLGTTGGEPELVLRSRVQVLEEIDGPDVWLARLAMSLEFVDAMTGATVLAWSFDRKGPMPAKSVGEFPVACSRILEEELWKAEWELARTLGKKGS
jgi:ABC-type uncharacterized transport system auxiliary subunit